MLFYTFAKKINNNEVKCISINEMVYKVSKSAFVLF